MEDETVEEDEGVRGGGYEENMGEGKKSGGYERRRKRMSIREGGIERRKLLKGEKEEVVRGEIRRKMIL